MQGRFEFEAGEVRALVEEADSAEERLLTEAQRFLAAGIDLRRDAAWVDEVDEPATGAPPGLWLMNDRGVYLRSNASHGGDRVAYARGHRADIPFGEERLCEVIDAGPLRQLRDGDTLVLTVGDEKISVSLVRHG
jgi:hypothetical protein